MQHNFNPENSFNIWNETKRSIIDLRTFALLRCLIQKAMHSQLKHGMAYAHLLNYFVYLGTVEAKNILFIKDNAILYTFFVAQSLYLHAFHLPTLIFIQIYYCKAFKHIRCTFNIFFK